MAIKVFLREKRISKGRKSLYLDFYPPIPSKKTGKLTRREFLGLYTLDKTKDAIDKQHNTDTMKIARSIRQKRENMLNKPEVYDDYEKERLKIKRLGEQCFVDYFRKLTFKRTGSSRGNWLSALKYLERYTNGSHKFSELNERFLEDFKKYLLTTTSTKSSKSTLSVNSASSYFNKIRAALREAYNIDRILQVDLNSHVKPIKGIDTRRAHLTLDELNELVKTPCNNDLLKRAALFSALTGLRFSDIQKLTWNEVEHIKGRGYFLNFVQQKTKGIETLPISKQGYQLLGERKAPEYKVFEGLKYSAYHNKHLFQWIGAASITKDITFHCFRHTYAVLQLSSGTSMYTLSKMLGHKDLKTTQIYAKLVDEAKMKAANNIKLDMKS